MTLFDIHDDVIVHFPSFGQQWPPVHACHHSISVVFSERVQTAGEPLWSLILYTLEDLKEEAYKQRTEMWNRLQTEEPDLAEFLQLPMKFIQNFIIDLKQLVWYLSLFMQSETNLRDMLPVSDACA